MGTLSQNLRFALRQLAGTPDYTDRGLDACALDSANTAIFSIVNALMREPAYAHPERMAPSLSAYRLGSSDNMADLDGQEWEGLRDNVPSLISAVSSGIASGVNLQAGSRVQYLHAARVRHISDVLGIQPWRGATSQRRRTCPTGRRPRFSAMPCAQHFWRRPQPDWQAIHLKGEPYTVIGILPEGATTL